MKKILLAAFILVLAGTMVYAQQAGSALPNSAQTTQDAQQFMGTTTTNHQQFISNLADLTARNTSNKDLEVFNRLKNEITRLEASITSEENRYRASLDAGQRIDPEMLNRIQRLIDQHQAKMDELQAFISR